MRGLSLKNVFTDRVDHLKQIKGQEFGTREESQ